MNAERMVGQDEPLMIAWNAYKATEEYANSRQWAEYKAHLDGSLWAAFCAGYAACDDELRKQEPVGYIKYSIGELPRFEPVIFSKCKVEGYIADWKACYSAPIPPTVPDTNLETATNRNYLESIGQLPPTEGSKP